MNEFKEYTGPFVHSKETYKKIMMSYLIVFIPFLAYALYKNGLQALKIDNEVQTVARVKAQDMVNNNYFSHNSPTYGTPFEMLNKYKVSYKTAGENIAGNSSNSAAVTAWMNSSGHKANILNSNFNYTGIGVVKSNKYGKIYVQMFIGK